MAQPQAYNRETDFTDRDGDDTNHAAINEELDAAALSINQLRANAALIQRDDGALKNGIVTADALDDSAFDAVLVQVNEAVQDAEEAATSALVSATTANTARDQAVAARIASETARDATIANANAASASALAASNSQTAAAASQASATASATAAAGSQSAAATSATSAGTSATTATTQAGIATTKAGEAAASATASASSAAGAQTARAGAETARDDAQTARTQAQAAQAAAASSASAAAAAQSAASSSASSAGTSATAAAASQAAAATSQSAAATSEANALAHKNAAATSATAAAASQTAAASSQSAAASSATAASSSATAAAASESNAAASAAAAAAALDNFDDRYLGPKSSAPTLDNDGQALLAGALYYNTGASVSADKGMWVYDGGTWIKASASQQASLVTFEFVATAGQTTFTGNDANGVALSYIVGGLVVTLNGATLRPGDEYTATSGSSIVLLSAAAAGDELMVLAFASFNVANTYTQAQADAAFLRKAGQDGVTVSGGNVGIGTASPASLGTLAVEKQAPNAIGPIVGLNNPTGGGSALAFRNSSFTQNEVARIWTSDDGNFSANLSFGTKATGATENALVERARIDSSGRMLINATSTISNDTAPFQVTGGSVTPIAIRGGSNGWQIAFWNNAGNAVIGSITGATGSSTSYNTSSDYRLKHDIQPMQGALAKVQALRPVTYKWNADDSDGEGFIAHELQAVCPDAVTGEKDAVDADGNPVYQGIDTSFLVATLTAAIQEQQAIIQQLTARVAALEGK